MRKESKKKAIQSHDKHAIEVCHNCNHQGNPCVSFSILVAHLKIGAVFWPPLGYVEALRPVKPNESCTYRLRANIKGDKHSWSVAIPRLLIMRCRQENKQRMSTDTIKTILRRTLGSLLGREINHDRSCEDFRNTVVCWWLGCFPKYCKYTNQKAWQTSGLPTGLVAIVTWHPL